MQDDYSCQTSQPKSEPSDPKEDDLIDPEDQKTPSESAVTEVRFRNVMSQHEMEILTTLFPKCAETLAGVLRNRPQQFEDEL